MKIWFFFFFIQKLVGCLVVKFSAANISNEWRNRIFFLSETKTSFLRSFLFAAAGVPRLYFQSVNLLKPTGHVMHQQFNIQQFYILPSLYLCVLYLSENKQRLVPLTA